jgi:hypothetical protein
MATKYPVIITSPAPSAALMIVSIEPNATGYTLTLQRKGGDIVTLTIPKEALLDRDRLQRLAMAQGVRLRLKKYSGATWKGFLRFRFGIE